MFACGSRVVPPAARRFGLQVDFRSVTNVMSRQDDATYPSTQTGSFVPPPGAQSSLWTPHPEVAVLHALNGKARATAESPLESVLVSGADGYPDGHDVASAVQAFRECATAPHLHHLHEMDGVSLRGARMILVFLPWDEPIDPESPAAKELRRAAGRGQRVLVAMPRLPRPRLAHAEGTWGRDAFSRALRHRMKAGTVQPFRYDPNELDPLIARVRRSAGHPNGFAAGRRRWEFVADRFLAEDYDGLARDIFSKAKQLGVDVGEASLRVRPHGTAEVLYAGQVQSQKNVEDVKAAIRAACHPIDDAEAWGSEENTLTGAHLEVVAWSHLGPGHADRLLKALPDGSVVLSFNVSRRNGCDRIGICADVDSVPLEARDASCEALLGLHGKGIYRVRTQVREDAVYDLRGTA